MSTQRIIVGIDEAGRGALAGPVVAGACILTANLFRRRKSFHCWSPYKRKKADDALLADSKKLTPDERERSYAWIQGQCAFGVGIVDAETIDREGILVATERAMNMAIASLALEGEPLLLVDGRDRFVFPFPHRSIIRGDESEPCIAAASIVAKVTRDRMMREASSSFAHYDFVRHKGYGTQVHLQALREHGPCVLHRLTFLRSLEISAPSAGRRTRQPILR
ncbi:MAG: ribonuclease HII [Candidatus Peregrinibacteria bacterium]|nr:ribonuclease HII [Candidatus Peregrinibacteria bacterium]